MNLLAGGMPPALQAGLETYVQVRRRRVLSTHSRLCESEAESSAGAGGAAMRAQVGDAFL